MVWSGDCRMRPGNGKQRNHGGRAPAGPTLRPAFLSDSWTGVWRRRRGFYFGLAGTWILLIALVASGARSETVGFKFNDVGPWQYAMTQAGAILYYLRLSLWPYPLSIDYFDWPVAKTLAQAVPEHGRNPGAPGTDALGCHPETTSRISGPMVFHYSRSQLELCAHRNGTRGRTSNVPAAGRRGNPDSRGRLCPWSADFRQRSGRKAGTGGGNGPGLDSWDRYLSEKRGLSERTGHLERCLAKHPDNARAHNNVGSALGREGKDDEAILHFTKAILRWCRIIRTP